MDSFSTTVYLYEKMITGSKFDAALALQKEPDSGEPMPDFEALKNVKVIDYTILGVYPSQDKRRVTQIVEIRYFRLNNMLLKAIHDRQVWIYDEAEARWYLKSHLPDFK